MKKTLLVYLLITPVSILAADKDGNYAEKSPSCAQYAEWRNLGANFAEWWVLGYVSAYNQVARDTYHILGTTDDKSVMRWLDKWCRADPQNDLANGMEALTAELSPKRFRSQQDASQKP